MKIIDFIKANYKAGITVVGIMSGLVGFVVARDAKLETRAILEFKKAEKEMQIDKLLDRVSVQTETLESIDRRQEEFNIRFSVMEKKFETQADALSNHFKKENMLQDNIDFLQELYNDEKRKSASTTTESPNYEFKTKITRIEK